MKLLLMAALFYMLVNAVMHAEARTRDAGPDLPYSCEVIRFGAALRGFKNPPTKEQRSAIRVLEKEHGITPKQHRQAVACFKQ